MANKWKYITSAILWYCTMNLGLGIGLIGPSLVELSRKFETTIPIISKVFSVTTVAFLFGALTSGFLFNYVNRQLATVLFLLTMGFGTILLPMVPTLAYFFCIAAAVGFGWAAYDTAQLVWIIEIWENNAATALQAQCFAFALGTFISPVLTKSFLPEENMATKLALNITNSTAADINQSTFPNKNSQVDIPFLIAGILPIFGGILILVLYWVKKYEKPNPTSSAESLEQDSTEDCKRKLWTPYKVLLITLGFIFLSSYQGMELGNIQFFSVFTQFSDLKFSQQDGALILSGLTGAYTLGRLLGIFVAHRILPEYLLLSNVLLLILGNSILTFFADDVKAIWVGAVLIGIGCSTVFGAFYGYLEKHVKISNMASGILIVAIGAGSGLYPIVIGNRIESDPFVLMYANYFGIGIATICFLAIYIITQTRTKVNATNIYQDRKIAGFTNEAFDNSKS